MGGLVPSESSVETVEKRSEWGVTWYLVVRFYTVEEWYDGGSRDGHNNFIRGLREGQRYERRYKGCVVSLTKTFLYSD